MPRTLPWLLEPKEEGRVKRESTPRKRFKREADADPDLTPKPPTSPNRRDFMRSSQTPPTSPPRACPAEEFLVAGLDKDDAWVMVEDEFYAIAQTFTKHLHYAEYARLKKEAKAQSATAAREVERPTDCQTAISKALQLKKDAEALDARQKAGLAQLEGPVADNPEEDTDEDDGVWAGTHLHGLMTSPRKSRSLVGTHTLKSATRAAAGFGQAPRSNHDSAHVASSPPNVLPSRTVVESNEVIDLETASEDEFDFDGQIYPVPVSSTTRRQEKEATPSKAPQSQTPTARRQISATPMESVQKTPTMDKERPIPTPKTSTLHRERPSTTPKNSKPATVYKSRVQMLFDDLDGLPEPSQPISYISDKKKGSNPGDSATREASETNNLESKSRYNDVPTFLV
ncbi:hypothetical protein N7466_002096 [Penicillium verhagenii]|uniref:uncharacterized protein n=1 Tax=Penicillium verhagenii TaxID=1562060 RepID=UPI0025452DCC|nr:uncharacterized protein N7466_002096 [Penicillium verhagenii]KAJ5938962.1 hypothetical protein N7466_002096 [Penicillium verhagenii]